MIRGEGDNIGAHLVATSLLRTALVSQPLDAERWASFRSILDGAQEADIALVAIRNAQSYIHAGAYDFALLLATIAAEVATTRYVHSRLQEAGVSRKKLRDVGVEERCEELLRQEEG